MAHIEDFEKTKKQFEQDFSNGIGYIVDNVIQQAFQTLQKEIINYMVQIGFEWDQQIRMDKCGDREFIIRFTVPTPKLVERRII